MSLKVLILGGVATGPKTAARLRRLDPDAEITVIERQDVLSYAGCGMPYYIEDVIKDYNKLLGGSTIRDADYFKQYKDFTVYTQTEALKINRRKRTVTVKDLRTGETRDLPYDKLVLATGASPFVPHMSGTDLKGVYRLYNPHNAEEIKSTVNRGCDKVAVVGGGLIGMETCGAFVSRGCDTTVIEMMPTLVPNLMDDEMALLLENYLKYKGVKVVKGSPVAKILDDGKGNAVGVQTKDGNIVKADLVILAIGVRPNTELALEAGLEIGSTRAIVVNEYLQTSDPDIYAGGDCVECTNIISGEKVFAPLGSTANKHGRIIADNINGRAMKFPGVGGTAVFKVLDWNCGTTGLTEKKSKNLGYDIVTTIVPIRDYSNYIPGSKTIFIKLIADRKTYKVLGCQILGEGDGIKRIDVIATAIKFGSNVKNIADIDLGYAPAYSTAIDAIAHAANMLRNKIDGIAHGINSSKLKEKLDGSEDFILLDVRQKGELETVRFKDKRVINISIDHLKMRASELPKDKEIILSCAVGQRAYNGERILRGKGFEKVNYLEGSIVAWPYPDYLI